MVHQNSWNLLTSNVLSQIWRSKPKQRESFEVICKKFSFKQVRKQFAFDNFLFFFDLKKYNQTQIKDGSAMEIYLMKDIIKKVLATQPLEMCFCQ
jgi:hypothetical protein